MLLRSWQSRGWLARLLWPLSLVLGMLVRRRQQRYASGQRPSSRLPAVVVVVGNVVAGGAGKTPVVIALIEHLRRSGISAGVISRGYGRQSRDCLEVTQQSLPSQVGDEPLLIHRRTGVPVFVAPQRVQAAQALLARHPQTHVIVSDDGLQHLALQRDLDICIFDNRGVGNGWLLPAGPLREPWPRAVDMVLHTGDRPAFAGYRAQRRLAPHARRADGHTLPLHQIPGPIHAVAAIAQPERFFEMLRQQGLRLDHTTALPDHADFTDWDGPAIAGATVLCTEKDAYKLWPRIPEAWAVPLEFEPERDFWTAFDRKVQAALSSLPSSPALPNNPHPEHGQQTS